MDSFLGEYLGGLVKFVLEPLAYTTLVNGVATEGRWQEAAQNRVQMFIDESEWQEPIYEILFADDVRQAPWNLKNGSSLVWQKFGRRFTVRRVSPRGGADSLWLVSCIAIEASGP